jgi:signal transduction histidine kinase
MKRLSLRDRVTLVATAVLAIALVVVSIVGNLLLSNRLEADTQDVLRNRVDAQLVTLDANDGRLRVRESANDGALDEQSWVFDGKRAVARGRAGSAIQAAAQSLAGVDRPTFRTVHGRVKLLAKPALGGEDNRRIGTVVVGVSLLPYEHTEKIARVGTLVLDFFLLLAGAMTVRWAVGRALRPVHEMTERAADWSEHDLHRRFGIGEPYDELTGLADTLDTLLGRIDAAMRREQRVTAEIAHELRTPLTSIRAEAELALRDGGAHDEDALRQIIAGTDRMTAAIETLLAAHVGIAREGLSCDALESITEAVEVVQPNADANGVEVTVSGSAGLRVATESRVLAQTLAPLLENAVRHAQRRTSVEVTRDGPDVVVTVTDDGAGIAVGSGTRIFAPGVSGGEGAGLGLPLARRLARTYGADITAVETPAGGRFELRIPADSASNTLH